MLIPPGWEARLYGRQGCPPPQVRHGVADSYAMEISYAWNDAVLFPGGRDAALYGRQGCPPPQGGRNRDGSGPKDDIWGPGHRSSMAFSWLTFGKGFACHIQGT